MDTTVKRFVAISDTFSPFGKRIVEAYGKGDRVGLANLLGFKTTQGLYKVLNGKAELSFNKLIRFRDYTKCSLDWLLTGEGSKYLHKQFDLEYSIDHHDDWRDVINEWYEFDGLPNPMPDTMGASFMGGWQSFDLKQKVAAITDFRNFLDTLSQGDDSDEV